MGCCGAVVASQPVFHSDFIQISFTPFRFASNAFCAIVIIRINSLALDSRKSTALNLGLSAVSAVGNGMREYRQTEEIARSRAELTAAKEREAEMSERIRALEQIQMQKGGQPIYYAQPPVQQMAPVPVQQ